MVIPTDRGVRVLGSCNEGYMNMIHTLEELVEGGNLPNYTVPRARQKSQLYFNDGTIDYSVLKYVALRGLEGILTSQMIYPQPYSETSLDRVVHELGRRYNMMKELFQENEQQKLRQKLEGDLNNED